MSPSSFSVNKIRDNRAFRKSINNSEVKTHEAAMQLFTVKTESKVCFKISEAYIIEKKEKRIILRCADNCNFRAKCNLAVLIGLRVFR